MGEIYFGNSTDNYLCGIAQGSYGNHCWGPDACNLPCDAGGTGSGLSAWQRWCRDHPSECAQEKKPFW